MNLINIYQAKSQLSQLIQQALKGEEVIIAKAGKPLIKLTPVVTQNSPKQSFGSLKNQITISPEFDADSPNITRAFYETSIEPTP